MKCLIIATIAVAHVGCATTRMSTTADGQPVKTGMYATYDRVRGITDVTSPVFYKVPMLGPAVGLEVHAFHRDTVFVDPLPHVYFVFNSTSGTQTEGWAFLKQNDLALLINGTERIQLEGVHDGDVGSILLKERIVFKIPTTDALRVGAASTVEGMLGNWRFTLKPGEIDAIQQLALYADRNRNAPLIKTYVR